MAESISAYELKSRVEAYDRDMDIMHPNRYKMAEIPIEFIDAKKDAPLKALDLGVGTGFFTLKFLQAFPNAHVVGVDGAAAMVDSAKVRLGNLASSVDFVVADFRDIQTALQNKGPFDVVFSSFALHHLTDKEKLSMLQIVLQNMKPGGLFINADNVIAETSDVEKRFQELRVRGIVERAPEADERFNDPVRTRNWLDTMEAKEKDNPIKLSQELDILSRAGFEHVDVLWKECREVVMYGRKEK